MGLRAGAARPTVAARPHPDAWGRRQALEAVPRRAPRPPRPPRAASGPQPDLWADLPVAVALPDVLDALATSAARAAVLEAPPGSGKTTGFPLALLAASPPWLATKTILVVEPRRLAARAAAGRMAALLGERVGGVVGFRVRNKAAVSSRTRILVVTPGIALRMVADARGLAGVGCVLLDEAHERGVESDLIFALLAGPAGKAAPELRVVVASATLGGGLAERAAALLGNAPVVRAPAARMFPVAVRYAGEPPPGTRALADAVVAAVKAALAASPGDALVFLPGIADVRSVAARLAGCGCDVMPLHGGLSPAAQDAVLAPRAPGASRRVVLSTPVAESSVTVPGVRVVVDCGMSRVPEIDAATGLGRLATRPISAASADQRAGRAGRLAPGVCVRLWSEASHVRRPAAPQAALVGADAAPMALTLAAAGLGSGGWRELPWLDAPAEASMDAAFELLQGLGLVDGARAATREGAAAAALGAHPRLAAMLLAAAEIKAEGSLNLAAVLASLASARDVCRGRTATACAAARVAALAREGALAASVDRRAAEDVLDSALLLARQATAGSGSESDDGESDDDGPPSRERRHRARAALAGAAHAAASATPALAGALLAMAYPDRVAARRERGNRGRTASFALPPATSAALRLPSGEDHLNDVSFIVAATVGSSAAADRAPLAFLAAAVDPARAALLAPALASTATVVEWVPASKRVVARRRTLFGAAVVADEADASPAPSAVEAALEAAMARGGGPSALGEPAAAAAWRARVVAAAAAPGAAAHAPWPAAAAPRWLAAALAPAAVTGLAGVDWVPLLVEKANLTPGAASFVDAAAPAAWAPGAPGVAFPIDHASAPPAAVIPVGDAIRLKLTGGPAEGVGVRLVLGSAAASAATLDALWAAWPATRETLAKGKPAKKLPPGPRPW